MTGLFQRLISILVFSCAVMIGMQLAHRAVAQQVPTLPAVGLTPPATGASAPPPSAPAPAAPTFAPPNAPPGSPNPNLPPGAAHLLNDPNQPAQAAKVPKKEVPFVPSEVEQYIPSPARAGDPRAILHTSMGNITIHLFVKEAPRTVRNFIDLALGDKEFMDVKTSKRARRPFYANLTFHRIVPGYLIQAGCPFGNGRGGPGYSIQDEFSPNLRFAREGMVAMAPERDGAKITKDSNGSQFFITLNPVPEWDDQFTIFGEVEQGMDVVHKISHARTGPTDRPIRRVFLNQVEILDEATAGVLSNRQPENPQVASPAVPVPPGQMMPPPPPIVPPPTSPPTSGGATGQLPPATNEPPVPSATPSTPAGPAIPPLPLPPPPTH